MLRYHFTFSSIITKEQGGYCYNWSVQSTCLQSIRSCVPRSHMPCVLPLHEHATYVTQPNTLPRTHTGRLGSTTSHFAFARPELQALACNTRNHIPTIYQPYTHTLRLLWLSAHEEGSCVYCVTQKNKKTLTVI